MWVELTTFVLGGIFAFALQFLATRLGLLREQARESWVRRLNSYQDFTSATVGLAELWKAGIEVPPAHAWDAITQARKAAYDASLYDGEHPALTSRMQRISADLVRLAPPDNRDRDELQGVIDAANGIWLEFAAFEQALRLPARSSWLARRDRPA